MALFDYKSLHELEMHIPSNKSYEYLSNRAIKKASIKDIQDDSFDIFLSHSYNDKEMIPALKYKLEEMGYSVYVDWITDRLLSREDVNKKTAEVLQKRMQQSKCLVYATSENSQNSRWMPWELGYFDGIKSKMVGVLPIKKENSSFNSDFEGEEYLGLYFYITIDKLSRVLQNEPMAMERNALNKMVEEMNEVDKLFINEKFDKFILFEEWLKGNSPYTLEERHDKCMEDYRKNKDMY